VGFGFTNDGQFGPVTAQKRLVTFAFYEIETGMATFQARGIQSAQRTFGNQLETMGSADNGFK
jgi:hypothetical protein